MQHESCKIGKPNNSKLKTPPHLTVNNVRGLRGNFTDLEAFMLKNNSGIFARCETNPSASGL